MFTEKQKKILFIVLMISLFTAFFGTFFSFNIENIGGVLKILNMSMPQKKFTANTNILVIGLDKEDKHKQRPDSILLVNINPYTKYVGMLSIPRDCRMPVAGHGLAKINAAYTYGGMPLLLQSVGNYLQTSIPYYVIVDLDGVADIVDALGGIPINVEERMHYIDRAGGLYIDLYPGLQTLNGQKALQYIRFRGDAKADLGRIDRQQKFIMAAGNKISKKGVIFRSPLMIFKIAKYTKTNIPSNLIVDFALKLRDAYQAGHLERTTIPSEPVYVDGVSYQQPNWNATQELMTRVIKGYEFYQPKLGDFRKPNELRVQVLNGTKHKGLAQNANRKLKKLGYKIIDVRNAGKNNYKQTLIVNWHGEKNEDEAFLLARELYIDPDNIVNYNYPSKPIDFSLVLGNDWPIRR